MSEWPECWERCVFLWIWSILTNKYVMLQTQFRWWRLKTGFSAPFQRFWCYFRIVFFCFPSGCTNKKSGSACCVAMFCLYLLIIFISLTCQVAPLLLSSFFVFKLPLLLLRPPFGASDQTGSVISAALTSIRCCEANLTVRQLKSMVLPSPGLFLRAAVAIFPEKSAEINDRTDLKIFFLRSECSLHWKNVLRAFH